MARIAQIHVRKQRGQMIVTGMSRTPRGQRVIAATEVLEAKSIHDPNLKSEVASAVSKMVAQQPALPL